MIDADGNLEPIGFPELQEDQTIVDGWEFVFETDATILNSFENVWSVSYGPDGASVTLTEVPQEGFELLDALCITHPGEVIVGELNGSSLTFQLQVEETDYGCLFFNTPSAVDSVGGGTGTPPSNTLPPTDSGESTSAPTSDGWRVMLVVLVAILAAALVSFPIGRADRTISRRR